MFNLNRITLIGNTGADAKVNPNGPTTIPFATNASWTDSETNERRTRAEWHLLVIWNGLGRWAATLPKGTPLFVEGELIYEQYPQKTDTTINNKAVQVKVMTRIAKIRVQKLIRLDSSATAPASEQEQDTEGKA